MKLSYLIRGLPGHPLHPPLTDFAIGAYTFATAAAIAQYSGITSRAGGYGWWIALIFGFIATAGAVVTGLADWITITRGTPLWRTATTHALVNVTATALFVVAAIIGHSSYTRGDVSTGAFILTLAGLAVLLLGGWLGGAITYVHGMRVLGLPDEPAARAAAPVPTPEKKEAAET